MRILLVAAEVAPFAKVGGLADVAGALPKALASLGHDVRVAMPCYRMIEDDARYGVRDLVEPFSFELAPGDRRQVWVRQTSISQNIPVYLIGGHPHFQQATDSKRVYSLEADPYAFLDRAVLEAIPHLPDGWSPDVVHCNDWHTGLVPVYLDTLYRDVPQWRDTSSVFTIHNLAYQGEFGFEALLRAGLPDGLFNMHQLEFYGRVSFMKGGLVFSRLVNTVSETYAREIQTPEYGCGLDGLLRHLAGQDRLTGILNGIDFEEYNPLTDPRIPAHFSADDPSGKAACKTALQAECGLQADPRAALIGIVSRLADQKGFDLIREIADLLVQRTLQLVVLGTGDPAYEAFFRDLAGRFPQQVHARIGFDAAFAQRIYGGSDMFLMPSRFEPCGLGQLMSLRYGTIPVVRSTGGLADTIYDADAHPEEGNGFAFAEYDAGRLLDAVDRATRAFQDPQRWSGLVARALRCDFSWTASARRYVSLYSRARSLAAPAVAG